MRWHTRHWHWHCQWPFSESGFGSYISTIRTRLSLETGMHIHWHPIELSGFSLVSDSVRLPLLDGIVSLLPSS